MGGVLLEGAGAGGRQGLHVPWQGRLSPLQPDLGLRGSVRTPPPAEGYVCASPGAQIPGECGRGCTCLGVVECETRYTLILRVLKPGCTASPHRAPLSGSHLAESLLTGPPPSQRPRWSDLAGSSDGQLWSRERSPPGADPSAFGRGAGEEDRVTSAGTLDLASAQHRQAHSTPEGGGWCHQLLSTVGR